MTGRDIVGQVPKCMWWQCGDRATDLWMPSALKSVCWATVLAKALRETLIRDSFIPVDLEYTLLIIVLNSPPRGSWQCVFVKHMICDLCLSMSYALASKTAVLRMSFLEAKNIRSQFCFLVSYYLLGLPGSSAGGNAWDGEEVLRCHLLGDLLDWPSYLLAYTSEMSPE